MIRYLVLIPLLLLSFVGISQSISASGPVSFCAGGNVTLTVSNTAGITGYQWIKDGTNIPGQTTISINTGTSGNYTVKLNRTAPNPDTTIGPVVVTNNPIPQAPSYNIPASQCASAAYNFAVNTPLPGITYQWYFGDGVTGTGANLSHTLTATGSASQSFNVSVKAISAAGCVSDSFRQAVSVNQIPKPVLDDSIFFLQFNNCGNNTGTPTYYVSVNNNTSNPGSISGYVLNWGDGGADINLTNASFPINHTYASYGVFNLKVTATNTVNGCIGTSTYPVINQLNPAVGIEGPPGGSTQRCDSAGFWFKVKNYSNNSPGTIYQWNFGDGSPIVTWTTPLSVDSIYHNFTKSSCELPGRQFVVNVTAINRCDNTSASINNIKIFKKPEAKFDINTTPACINQPVNFINQSITSFNGPDCNNITGYQWNFGDPSSGTANTSSLKDPSHTYAAPGVYNVKLFANGNCGLDSIIKQVCITRSLTPGFKLDTSAGCAPFVINATDTSNNYNSCQNTRYLWRVAYTAAFCETTQGSTSTFTNGTSDTSANPSFSFTKAGTYTITQFVTNACGSFSTSKTVSIQNPPTVAINLPVYSCGIVNITPAATVTACSINPPTSYAWTFEGGSPATANTANPGNITFTTLGIHKITLAVTNDCGTTIDTDTVEVTTTPDVVPSADQTLCGGLTTNGYNFTSTIGTPVYNFTNSNPSIGLPASGSGNIAAFTATNNGAAPVTATIIVTPSVSNCVGMPDTFLITVNPRPSVPLVTSPVTYCQNATAATLTATASGTDTLTWYNNAALTGGTLTAPTPATSAPGTTLYYVTQTNSFSCLSLPATITINVNPIISGNTIAADQNICANTAPNAITSGNISGGNGSYNYQWQSSLDAGTTWGNISGANAITYAPPILNATIQYRRVINSLPCSDTSNIVTITVQGALTNFDIAANQVICEGFTPALISGQLPIGGGGGYIYQWQTSADNINWNNISGATGQDYQPAALIVTTFYKRIVTTPQCSATSNVVTITVNPTPAGTIAVNVPFICVADIGTVSFTATFGSAPFNVVLVVTNPAGVPDTVRQTINTNGPQNIQVIPANSAAGNYSVRIFQISDGKGCVSFILSPALSIAILTPIINVIEKDSIICNGQSLTIRNNFLSGGSATGLDSLYSYQWESTLAGLTNWQNIAGADSATQLVSPAVSTCYRRKVSTNGICQAISNSICITVNPGITNNSINASQQVCVNTAVNNLTGSTPIGGDNIYIYDWQTSTDSVTWSSVASSISYQPPIYTAAGIHYFRRNVSSGNCTQGSNVITIRVRPDSKAVFSGIPAISCAPFNLATAITISVLPDSNGTYNWYAGGILFGSNSTGILPAYTIAATDDTVVIKLVTRSQFGCKADSMQQTFITPRTAIASFTKDTARGCGPLDVTFNNTSNIINSSIEFFWNFGNGVTSTLAQPGTITFNTSPFFNDTTYQVSLKAYNGCDTTVWRDSIKIRSNPSARFGVATTFGCSPFTLQVNNTSLGGPGTYYWDFGNGHLDTTFTTGLLSYTYNIGNEVDTFPVRLIAVNECGIDTQIIKIRIAPNLIKPQVIISGSDLFGCAPHTVTFINATTGATIYNWDFGDNTPPVVTNNSQSTIIHTFNNPGTFTIAIAMSNGCSDTTVYRQVTVYAKPIASFTTNAPVYCLGDTIRVNNTSLNASNYQWFWGDGRASSDSSPIHVYTVAGDYSITLRAERNNNVGLVCFDTLKRNITVLVKPNAAIQSNSSTVNCAPFIYTAATPGVTNETVTWYINDSTVSPSIITSTGISIQYTFNNPGTFTVKTVAENVLGCRDSSTQTFTVKGTPVAGFTPLNIALCKTDTTVLHTNTTTYNDNGPLNYRWLVDGGQVSTNGNFTYRYLVANGSILPKIFNTWLIATNSAGCSDTAKGTLQMSPTAKAAFGISNPNDCVPFIATIVDNSKDASNYQWFLNGTLISNAPAPVITITQAAIAYNITLIATNQYSCRPDTFTINFTSRIKPVAAFLVSDTLGCTGVLNVATTNRSSFANFYTWDWGDNSASSSFLNATHLYNSQGQYLINLVASDGVCKDTASRLVRVSTKPIADFAASNTLTCNTAGVQFTNLSVNGRSYLWSFSDGTSSTVVDPYKNFAPSITPYTVKLVADDGLGCKDSVIKANLITAKVPPASDFFISPTPVITVPNYTFSFNNLTINSNKYLYQWDLGDGTFASTRDVAFHKYADTGNYPVRLIVLDTSTNCPDTTIRIARIDGFPGWLFVPNAICPNCIQSNLREFIPKGKGLKEYKLQIFTTWGELIFETATLDVTGAPTQSWDGRYKGIAVQQDVYVWKIFGRFMNGSEWQGMLYPGEGQYKKTGTITVVR